MEKSLQESTGETTMTWTKGGSRGHCAESLDLGHTLEVELTRGADE